jgi:DNA-binding GntR family transcriptional regulator
MAKRAEQRAGKRREPMSDVVLRTLRTALVTGEVKPGERIRQEEIARRCGTSRIPVREALKQLQTEGLVTLTSHVGARAARLDPAELHEIYLLRELLEPFAISLSAPHLDQSLHDRLRQHADRMQDVADVNDPAAWIELDRQFHLTSYSAAGLPRLVQIIESLWDSTQQYRRAYVRLPERLAVAHIEHTALIEAIVRRDAAEAERLSLVHIRRTRLELDDHAELFSPETFRSASGPGPASTTNG